MRNIKQVSGKLEIIKRLPSSINGNPRYLISINGVICKIGDHYGVLTLDSLKPAPVQLELF